MRLPLLAALAVLAAGCAGPTPTVRSEGAPFEDARAIAATADGTLYVIEGATGEIVVLRGGLVVDRLGGAGTTAEALIDPVALDPTNGQAIFVADRAAGALVQFTAEGRVAGQIRVPDVDPARPVRQAVRDGARGRPVAVAAAPDGALYVAEAGRGVVLRLDAEGTVERVLGAGLLREPVALAVADDGTLWVADAGLQVLVPFDAFGSPGETREVGRLGRLIGVAVRPGALLALGVGMGEVYRGNVESLFWRDEHVVRTDGAPPGPGGLYEPYRGAAFVGDDLVLLLPTRLGVQAVGPAEVD